MIWVVTPNVDSLTEEMSSSVSQFRMTEFGILEIVTDNEVKGQQVESNSETLDPAQSHTPTPPPEGQSQTSTTAAQTNQSQSASSQAKGTIAHVSIVWCCYFK